MRRAIHGVALAVVSGTVLSAQEPALPKRPRIVGVAHAAFYVNDMAKARAFYETYLGFASPYSLSRPTGGDLVFIKINDRQAVELFPASEVGPTAERLYHVALEVEDAEAMRVYLESRGVAVPKTSPVGRIGNRNYFVKDPSGNTVEIVQYLPESWTVREKGKFMPDTRISKRMMHVGVMIANLDSAMAFYRDILGFREFWRGTPPGNATLSWVNMRIPDGEDYIEFMLYDKYPPLERVHSLQHICLEVPSVVEAESMLSTRVLPAGSPATGPVRVGVNGKRQLNAFDPDGTRVELMEPVTADGQPRASSTAPAPVGERKQVTP